MLDLLSILPPEYRFYHSVILSMGITLDLLLDLVMKQLPYKSSMKLMVKSLLGKTKAGLKNLSEIKKLLDKLIAPLKIALMQKTHKTKKRSTSTRKLPKKALPAIAAKTKAFGAISKTKPIKASPNSLAKISTKITTKIMQKVSTKNPASSKISSKLKSKTLFSKPKAKSPIVINAIKSTLTKEIAKNAKEENARNNPISTH
ncbi:MAG TPA: hypothetical protein QF353_01015 [Gammaproteobacteria bacterium]|nr:hypothetical protein [Gammaproteobacteria bacterium]